MKNKMIVLGIAMLAVAVINGIIAIAILSLKLYGIENYSFDIGMIHASEFMTIFGIIFAIELALLAMKMLFNWSGNSSASLKNEKNNLENSQFLTSRESRKLFKKSKFHKPTEKGGILIGLDKNVTTLYPLQHTLLLGAQGTGKTVTYVSPQIEIILNSKNKPSIIVTDIKGELLRQHGVSVKEHGYALKILNLKDPLASFKWNPLEDILSLKIKEMKTTRKADYSVKIAEEINEVVESLFWVKNVEQSVWEESARDIIRAIIYAMVEDYELGRIIESQFNFVTVSDIVSQKGGDCEGLKKYFEFRELRSEARRLAMKALDAVIETRSGFINALENYLAPFADKAIATLVSGNEIDCAEVAKGNVAIFIEMSEIASTRHFIATAFLAKLYKELVTIADKNSVQGVKNNEIFYLLEEAGNLPAIPKLDKMLSAGRGRGVFVSLVIQSYSQLSKIYGENVSTTIRDNIDVEIFIGTSDLKTAEEFSRKCGNSVISTKSLSRNTSDSRMNINENIKERPLIYPTELMSLNNPPKIMGNAIVKIRGEKKPLKTKFTPYFKMKPLHTDYLAEDKYNELAQVPFYDIAVYGKTEKVNTGKKASSNNEPNNEKEAKQNDVIDSIKLSSTANRIIEKYSGKSVEEIGALKRIELLEIIEEIMSNCERSEKISLVSARKIANRGEKQ